MKRREFKQYLQAERPVNMDNSNLMFLKHKRDFYERFNNENNCK